MFIAAILLLVMSVLFFGMWIRAMTGMFRDKKAEFRKIDRTVKHSSSSVGAAGFSKEYSIVREKGFESELKSEMTYEQIAEGLKKKDPGVYIFLQIFIGFGVGLLSAIASIGCFVVDSGNTDGYFMIGFSLLFFLMFVFIVLDQRRRAKKKGL